MTGEAAALREVPVNVMLKEEDGITAVGVIDCTFGLGLNSNRPVVDKYGNPSIVTLNCPKFMPLLFSLKDSVMHTKTPSLLLESIILVQFARTPADPRISADLARPVSSPIPDTLTLVPPATGPKLGTTLLMSGNAMYKG